MGGRPPSRIEHLGLSLVPHDPNAPIRPRNGWEPVRDLIEKLGKLPGPTETPFHMVNVFIRPHFIWAAPLLEPPPKRFEVDLRRGITRTKSNWHCNARW